MDLKVGVIGCGYWGIKYFRVLHELSGIRIRRCSDLSEDRLKYVKEMFPAVRSSTNADDVLSDPDIQAVVIATPARNHLDLVLKAFQAGKHVLVEKPLATSSGECDRIIEAAKKADRTLMVDHTFVYNDSVRKMKEVIKSDGFGRPYYLAARRTNLGPIREDVSAVWDLATHDVSIFLYLLDAMPIAVSAAGRGWLKPERPDVAFITLFFPDDVIGSIQVSWVDSNKIREVVAIGERQRVVFDDVNVEESIRIFEKGVTVHRDVTSFGEFQYLVRDGDILSPKVNKKEPLKNAVTEFYNCVTKGQSPLADGAAGRNVVRVLEKCTESIQKDGQRVEIG